MATTDQANERADRRWAYRHPLLSGLTVFAVLYLPLAAASALNGEWNETLLALPGALFFGGLWFALYRWGAVARGPQCSKPSAAVRPSEAERNLAQISQLGVLIVPAIVPALVLVASRDKKPFVRAYAVQALNLQLVLAVAMMLLVAGVLATDFDGVANSVVQLLGSAVYGYCLAVSLMGTIKSSNGILWRYPATPSISR